MKLEMIHLILELRKIASIPPDAFEREYFQCLGPVYQAREVNKAAIIRDDNDIVLVVEG